MKEARRFSRVLSGPERLRRVLPEGLWPWAPVWIRMWGSAYVFRFNGSAWVEDSKLSGGECPAVDSFGVSVSVSASEEAIAIGVASDDEFGFNSGAACLIGKPVAATRVPSLGPLSIAALACLILLVVHRRSLV